MRTSLWAMAIGCVAAGILIAAPVAMGRDKEESATKENKDTRVAKVEKYETKQVAYLGLGVEPLHPAFWAHLRDMLEHKQGLLVARVAEGSPADKAGVKTDDILMTYGDQKLFSPEQLAGLVQADKIGHEVNLGILREGKPQEISVTLGERAMVAAERTPRLPAWHMPRWFTSRMSPSERSSSWETFDSMTLKRLGNDGYRVEIGYEAKDGKIEHRTFEGTLEEIHKDIMAQKDLPADEREHLLRSLDMPAAEFQLDFPGVYYTPDGRVIWGFDNYPDSGFRSVVPSDF